MKIYIVIASVLLTGCLGRNVQIVYKDIEVQRRQMKGMLMTIDSLDQKREEKRKKGELDEKTDSIAAKYIRQLKDSISSRLARYEVLSDNKTLRSNKKAAIAYLNTVKGLYKNELENIIFFDDLFNTTTFSRLNTAAFFAPGQYQLDDAAALKAKVIMGDIIGDAWRFSNKYASRKLKAMFIVMGYADEEAIIEGSELHQSLVTGTSGIPAGRKQLNKELSSRRAASIKNILKKEYELLSNNNLSSNLSVDFLAIGKGEELPRGLITDYKPVDERRRVVLLYWSILPEL